MGRTGYKRVSQREYAAYLGISNEAVSRAVKDGRIKKGWDSKAAKIIVEHADMEFGLLHKKTTVPIEPLPGEDPPQQTPGSLQLSGNSSFGEAKRVREIIQAQLAALDLKERKGELVSKEEVYKQLFAFGQQIRAALMAIPDRIIDNLLASKQRADAHNLLTGEIHSALENLTKTDFNFQGRQK